MTDADTSGLDEIRRAAGISDEEWMGFKRGDHSARITVRDWHPKCATCMHYETIYRDLGLCTLQSVKVMAYHYCADHEKP